MEFDEVVRKRRMVRNYDPDRPVPAAVVDRLLDHAIRAPSAGFSQGWGFLVLETRRRPRRVLGGDHAASGPAGRAGSRACAGRR